MLPQLAMEYLAGMTFHELYYEMLCTDLLQILMEAVWLGAWFYAAIETPEFSNLEVCLNTFVHIVYTET